jgi:hypothetical protein
MYTIPAIEAFARPYLGTEIINDLNVMHGPRRSAARAWFAGHWRGNPILYTLNGGSDGRTLGGRPEGTYDAILIVLPEGSPSGHGIDARQRNLGGDADGLD